MEETDQRKTIAMPSWMCERIESSAAENARSFTGEVNARLAASFGMKPNGLPVPLSPEAELAGTVARKKEC